MLLVAFLEAEVLNWFTIFTGRCLVDVSRYKFSAKITYNDAISYTLSPLVNLEVTVTPCASSANFLNFTIRAQFGSEACFKVRLRALRASSFLSAVAFLPVAIVTAAAIVAVFLVIAEAAIAVRVVFLMIRHVWLEDGL